MADSKAPVCQAENDEPRLVLDTGAGESRFASILETVLDGIILINDKGQIELFNPAAERIFGYRCDEVVGQNVSLLMSEPHRSDHDSYLESFLQAGMNDHLTKPLSLEKLGEALGRWVRTVSGAA